MINDANRDKRIKEGSEEGRPRSCMRTRQSPGQVLRMMGSGGGWMGSDRVVMLARGVGEVCAGACATPDSGWYEVSPLVTGGPVLFLCGTWGLVPSC